MVHTCIASISPFSHLFPFLCVVLDPCCECDSASSVWSCRGDGGCDQSLCSACDTWIHSTGTLASHARTQLRVVCCRCRGSADVHCATCDCDYCATCSTRLHAKGTRAAHVWELLSDEQKTAPGAAAVGAATPASDKSTQPNANQTKAEPAKPKAPCTFL